VVGDSAASPSSNPDTASLEFGKSRRPISNTRLFQLAQTLHAALTKDGKKTSELVFLPRPDSPTPPKYQLGTAPSGVGLRKGARHSYQERDTSPVEDGNLKIRESMTGREPYSSQVDAFNHQTIPHYSNPNTTFAAHAQNASRPDNKFTTAHRATSQLGAPGHFTFLRLRARTTQPLASPTGVIEPITLTQQGPQSIRRTLQIENEPEGAF